MRTSNDIIKFKLITILFGLLSVISTPLTAAAETVSFSGKGEYGTISGTVYVNGNLEMSVSAFKSTSMGNSSTTSPGASFWGTYYTDSECWYGYGFSDAIQFSARAGKLPSPITTSGTILVTWYEYCSGSYPQITETVTFTGSLMAMKKDDELSRQWSSGHSKYGPYMFNYNQNYVSGPAQINNVSISSPAFGAVSQGYGFVGKSRSHSISIVKQ